jgi:hypothetical protein
MIGQCYYPGLSSASLEITEGAAGADTSLTGTSCLIIFKFLLNV